MSEMEEKKEKGKGKEEEEEVILDHFYHEHPLTLSKSDDMEYEQCYGCRRYIVSGETVYKCRDKCRRSPILHEECAEMPREIRLSMHPQHTLIQREDTEYVRLCAVCKSDIMWIGYYCSSPDSCSFNIHVGCAPDTNMLKRCIDHPSHSHQLTLLWRPCLSRCDACGITQRGNSSYICIDCNYWIHESCKDLPPTADYSHLHHHPLSLAFHLPPEYIKFNFPCAICFKEFLPKYWVYHCTICRYAVHIKCAIKSSSATIKSSSANTEEGAADIVKKKKKKATSSSGGGGKQQRRRQAAAASSSGGVEEEEGGCAEQYAWIITATHGISSFEQRDPLGKRRSRCLIKCRRGIGHE